MKNTKFAVLGLILCAAFVFQFLHPAAISAKEDELSDTFWTVDRTIFALEFVDDNNVTLLRRKQRGSGYERLSDGTYSVRRNTVKFYFEGETGNATISGRNRNIMTGKIYVDGVPYTIRATRQD